MSQPPADAFEDFAERLKLEVFDRQLHDDPEVAAELASFIEQVGVLLGRPRILALGLLASGDVARQLGRAAAAMGLFDQAADVYWTIGDHVGWARARGGWVVAATYAGRITESGLARMDAVCRVLEEAGLFYRLAMVEQNIGVAYQWLARYKRAIAMFDRALAHLGPGETPHELNLRAMLLGNRANSHLWLGNLDEAWDLHARARDLFRLTGNAGLAALADMNLAIIERLRWHLPAALRLIRSAISGLRRANQRVLLALALVFQADILLALQRDDEASALAAEAVDIFRASESPIDLSDALYMRARVHLRQGNEQAAEDALREAEHILLRSGASRSVYPIAVERARLLLAQGRAAEAKEVALDVLRARATQDTRVHRGMALLVAAEATLALDNLELARRMARAALAQAKRLRSPEIAHRAHLVLARAARRAGDATAALAHYDAMTTTLAAVTDDLVYTQRSAFLEDKDALYLEALAFTRGTGEPVKALLHLERNRARPVWTPTSYGDGDPELEKLHVRYRAASEALWAIPAASFEHARAVEQRMDLERQIRDVLELGAERGYAPPPLNEAALLRATAGSGTTLAWALAEDDLIIFVIADGRVTTERLAGGARRAIALGRNLRLCIDTFWEDIAEQGEEALLSPDTGTRQGLRALWELLIAPVAHLLPADGEPLTIVAHDILHILPLLALHDGDRYLAQRWAVRRAPSCMAMSGWDGMVAPHVGGPQVALGYSAGGVLPCAPQEAREVAALMEGEALIEADATVENLRRQAPGRAYLHIAAHAEWLPDTPALSYIWLAKETCEGDAPTEDGCPLYPLDAARLQLGGCRLVTLSACETGAMRPRGGDEQGGLVAAFGFAGAQAVLATLWKVDDSATLEFMRRFYQRIADGAAPDEALRDTQRAFICGAADALHAHPYFWAAFQLTTYAARSNSNDRPEPLVGNE